MYEPNRNKIKLVVGLGNPGPEYENTYHNAGFLFVDYLKESRHASRFTLHDSRLLKSDTFMNESGAYVKKAMKKYSVKPDEAIVAHDESDLPLGTFKLSFDRSSAGHKGVQSIIDALGTKEFWRLRIGIRPQKTRGQELEVRSQVLRRTKALDFVLKKITLTDQKILEGVFAEIEKSLTL